MYFVFRDLAIIILSAKFFALVARKCKAPQVVGEIIAGLIIGPCLLNLVQTSDAISIFAEIGVVLLMFSTGLGTNLKELMRAGPIATLIASIGLKTDISGLTPEILLFCICFVIVALLTKIIGCGLAAKICRFNWGDSLKVGVGMMTRGEVALIVAQKGLEVGVVDPVYFTAVILLIVVSSVATPLALKALFTKMPPVPHPSQTKA